MIHAAAPAPAQARPGVTPQIPSPAPPQGGAPTDAGPPIGTRIQDVRTNSPRPLTRADVEALADKRSELSNQLSSAVGRRNRVAEQLKDATGLNQKGLEDRLTLLDQRIVQIEGDIAANGRALAAAPAELAQYAVEQPSSGFNPSSGQITAISIVFLISVLMPLSIALARLLWRRATRWGKPMPPAPEITRRLDNLSQGMEAIAIEVERISEGQRFITNLFGENAQRALGAGERPAEPVRVRVPEGVRARE